MKLEQWKPSLVRMSTHEALEIIRGVRSRRFVPVERPKAVRKKIDGAKALRELLSQLSEEELAQLMKELEK